MKMNNELWQSDSKIPNKGKIFAFDGGGLVVVIGDHIVTLSPAQGELLVLLNMEREIDQASNGAGGFRSIEFIQSHLGKEDKDHATIRKLISKINQTFSNQLEAPAFKLIENRRAVGYRTVVAFKFTRLNTVK